MSKKIDGNTISCAIYYKDGGATWMEFTNVGSFDNAEIAIRAIVKGNDVEHLLSHCKMWFKGEGNVFQDKENPRAEFTF